MSYTSDQVRAALIRMAGDYFIGEDVPILRWLAENYALKAQGEPVAWRFRYPDDDDGWYIVDGNQRPADMSIEGWEPLYSAPSEVPAKEATELLRELFGHGIARTVPPSLVKQILTFLRG